MVQIPSVYDLLKDPTLSFGDFCFITNALERGHSGDEILKMPELAHLRVTVDSQHIGEPDL